MVGRTGRGGGRGLCAEGSTKERTGRDAACRNGRQSGTGGGQPGTECAQRSVWEAGWPSRWGPRAGGRINRVAPRPAGKGLGRKENGITQALRVTLKQDTHGVRLGCGDGRGGPWGWGRDRASELTLVPLAGGTRPCQGVHRPLVGRALQQDCIQLGGGNWAGMSANRWPCGPCGPGTRGGEGAPAPPTH